MARNCERRAVISAGVKPVEASRSKPRGSGSVWMVGVVGEGSRSGEGVSLREREEEGWWWRCRREAAVVCSAERSVGVRCVSLDMAQWMYRCCCCWCGCEGVRVDAVGEDEGRRRETVNA